MAAIKPGRKVLKRAVRPNLHALKAVIKVRGLYSIDRRTLAAQSLFRWKRALIEQLGGESEVTATRAALIDLACRTMLYVEHLDCWLMEQKSLIDEKAKATLPLLLQRQSLVDSLTKILKTLGLNRLEKSGKVLSLREYWEQPVTETSEDGEGKESSAR